MLTTVALHKKPLFSILDSLNINLDLLSYTISHVMEAETDVSAGMAV